MPVNDDKHDDRDRHITRLGMAREGARGVAIGDWSDARWDPP
jgi:hypothetical protein